MKLYHLPANKENTIVKDNDIEPHVDGDNSGEPSFYSKSESFHHVLPGENDAFIISPDFKPNEAELSKVNELNGTKVSLRTYVDEAVGIYYN